MTTFLRARITLNSVTLNLSAVANNRDCVPINHKATRSCFFGRKWRSTCTTTRLFISKLISYLSQNCINCYPFGLNSLRKVSSSYAGVTVSRYAAIRTLFLLCLCALKQKKVKSESEFYIILNIYQH